MGQPDQAAAMAREALAEVASRFSSHDGLAHATAELEGIADFIYTRTS